MVTIGTNDRHMSILEDKRINAIKRTTIFMKTNNDREIGRYLYTKRNPLDIYLFLCGFAINS